VSAAGRMLLFLSLTRQEANRLCQLFRRQINHNKQTYGIVRKREMHRRVSKNNVCVAPEIDFSCQHATRASVRLFSLHRSPGMEGKTRTHVHSADL
jgi:hypothetical protein